MLPLLKFPYTQTDKKLTVISVGREPAVGPSGSISGADVGIVLKLRTTACDKCATAHLDHVWMYIFVPTPDTRLWGPPSLLYSVYRRLFPRG
jgi:hypothetical protein